MVPLTKREHEICQEFMRQHENCDELVMDEEIGLPIKAIYLNPIFLQIKTRLQVAKILSCAQKEFTE